ncbi:MAG TPA: GNAT family N-acetyltransferase [Candidatus Baltobacteraceae bacterium]|nr:GNAT family N-acetyltransferase [Candidatus Baltobacteraceae bacterium]
MPTFDSGPNIRVATTQDEFRQLHDLLVEYEHALPPDLRHAHLEDELQNLSGLYRAPNAALLALRDGTAVGCVALCALDGSTGITKRLYVKPAYRKDGAARRLMQALIEFSRGHHYERLVLDTDRTRLKAAFELYVSLGFVECEAYGDVDYACPTYMELHLQERRRHLAARRELGEHVAREKQV